MKRCYRRGKGKRGRRAAIAPSHNNRTVRLEQEEPQTPVHAGPSSSGDPSSSSLTQNSVVPELPGFYYDADKNRYFRLLPGHNNYNPLTKESIQYKAMECKRLKLLEEEEKQKKKTTRAGLNSSMLLQKRQLGLLSSTTYCRLVHELKVNCMHRRKIEIHSPDSSVAGTNNFKIIVADVACERIFTVNDVEHGGCKYGDRPGMLCSFKISTAWSCAWCLNPQINACFSTGLTRRVLVASVVTGHQQSFRTSSDVLAQQFATQTPVLYNGCRSGEIFSIDVRQCNRKAQSWKAIQLFHDSAVTSIRLLKAEHYLMAADMAGKIKLWDLRTAKCVKQYKGHHNEYAILPLHVNEEEGLLTAVGQDCYTRIWSLQDAHLLRTIPSPHPASKDAIPSVVFSSRLGGRQGVPGLLMAVKQDLYHYSYD
ncbi:DDB1- and CUL4-associated factor 4 isoform X3 [Lathamus discolor]|uniref:DDB1- and CUL4-associated factor 4 isoform X3 n=1 Tax=Lathamus discolor TaxID=678569 RepID=UPI0032B84F80